MRRQGAVALLTLLIAQGVLCTLVSAQTNIIPSLRVSERYDSNVFFTPKSLLGPNDEPEDFITTVTPQITMAHQGSLMRGSLSVGALVSKYINNPDLDFTGYNAAGALDLTQAANKVSQRISNLTLRGTSQYTPSITGAGVAGAREAQGTIGTGQALNNGIVANRANIHRYNLGVTGSYQLTPTTAMTGSFDYTKVSFGNQSGNVNNPLFDTTGYLGSTTIATRISARDTVGASSTMSHFIQEQSNGSSGQGTYTVFSETLNWNRLWTQELSTNLAGGAIYRPPVGSDIPGQSVKSQIIPTAAASMTYSSFAEGLRGMFDSLPSLDGSLNPGGIMAPGAYTASLRSSYSIYPGTAFGSGPTKTYLLGANATGGIARNLTAQAGVNYAHGSSSNPDRTFDSVNVTGGLGYLIGPVLADLTVNWLYFSNSTTQSVGQSNYEFSKKMVMLAFSYAFTSPAFFREGISFPSSFGTGTGSSPSGDGSGMLRKE